MYLDCSILAVGALGVLLVHELGHLLMARSFGFCVAALSVGLGPEIFGHTDRSGTRWKMGALPIGGSCVLSDAANRRSFSTASLAQRALIYAAGPFLNLVLAAIDFVAIDFEGGGSAFVSLDMRLEVLIGAFSASVGLFNLLPILPLDGGRLLLIAFEAVRGRRVGEREEKRLLRIGLSVLASTTGVSVLFLFKVIG
ncbi:site-2 protease family protein [uncultured Bradyrhizobium sp.]|uniref:site-2 protease family protein n=1 Tax=Bradyrhizobium sp. TaxID=376 RepID=UPI0026236A91|nr:site-2 protease family protein [uncultured Bradyrhizobium sp.]